VKDSIKADFINYRLEKSDEAYKSACILFENSQWNSAVNRLYYACFHAVSALMLKTNITPKSHSGLKNQFYLNIIKKGLISRDLGILYNKLFDCRQKSDYDDFANFTEKEVSDLIKPVEDFLNQIKLTINK
jgi:uncharacterized protein (UPF0332 family)